MLIIGAKGFAKEVLEIFSQLKQLDNICFYDDINTYDELYLYEKFPILTKIEEVKELFKIDNHFTIGIGNPILRKKLYIKFTELGGVFTSTISPLSTIGSFGNIIGNGCNIMTGAIITNDIKIDTGALVNLNVTIGHDTVIGKFVELSPGVSISGNCKIGNYCNIGSNATILPKISLGNNVVVGAGSVITKDMPDNCLVVGVPGKIVKNLEPLKF